jgi:hypothetical protein
MISEPVNKPDVQAVWRNYEIMRPASRENSRLLTLGQSDKNSIFGFSADRTWGDYAVYNLYNSDKNKSVDLTLDFADAGLPAGTRCAVYNFWENKVVGYATDSFTGKNIPNNGSLLLRFTPLTGDFPQLVGSNLHLSIGATDRGNLHDFEIHKNHALQCGGPDGRFNFLFIETTRSRCKRKLFD